MHNKPIVNWRDHTNTKVLNPADTVWLDLGWRTSVGFYDGKEFFHFNSIQRVREVSFKWALLKYPDPIT